MPNYCQNYLHITGPRESIFKFLLDHNFPTWDTVNDYSFLPDSFIQSYLPLHQKKKERLNFLLRKYPHYISNDPKKIEECSTNSTNSTNLIEEQEPWIHHDEQLQFSFDILLPIPEKVSHIEWNWYWWGTKWNITSIEDVSVHSDSIYIEFQTAWSPPVPWIRELASYDPTLKIELEYSEPGMDFWGKIIYENSTKIHNEEKSYTEHLYSEPGFRQTLYQMVSVILEESYPLSFYETMLEEKLPREYIAFDLMQEIVVDHLDEDQLKIWNRWYHIWMKYLETVQGIYENLEYEFSYVWNYIREGIEALKKIQVFIIHWTLKKKIRQCAQKYRIKQELVDFHYVPENKELPGTIYEKGGFYYREAKERFYQ